MREEEMKRFWLYAGMTWEPSYFQNDFDTLQEAKEAGIEAMAETHDWAEIIDVQTGVKYNEFREQNGEWNVTHVREKYE